MLRPFRESYWLVMKEEVRITSPLTSSDAIMRLNAALAERKGNGRLLRGYVSYELVEIRVSPGDVKLAPVFSGTMADLPDGGSELTGTFRPPSGECVLNFVFGAFFSIPIFVGGIYGFISNALDGHWGTPTWVSLFCAVAGLVAAPVFFATITGGIRHSWSWSDRMKAWLSLQLNP